MTTPNYYEACTTKSSADDVIPSFPHEAAKGLTFSDAEGNNTRATIRLRRSRTHSSCTVVVHSLRSQRSRVRREVAELDDRSCVLAERMTLTDPLHARPAPH